MTNYRTALTSTGQKVKIGKPMYKVDGGWAGWVLNSKGVAVSVFVPGE